MTSNADRAAVPAMDIAARLGRLREAMTEAGPDRSAVEALFVTNITNVRYLTGFTGSAALLLVGPDDLLFVTDGRYRDQAAEQLSAAGVDARIEISGVGQREIVKQAAAGYGRIGLEAHTVTWAQQRSFEQEWFDAAQVVPTHHVVERLRRIKDAGEIARISAACRIADEAFAAVAPRLAERPTEAEFALELEFAMRRMGAEAVSFEPIVAAGPNGAKPHARPGSRHIEPGELVVLDFGCKVDGYCSDMTRTVSVGDPGADARRMWDVVEESQAAGRAAVRAGAVSADVDRACREVIEAAGWGDAFLHGTGHGVGLDIHEDPRVASTSRDTLAVGHVVTVEPGVYLTGAGGVRIEDTVVVTETGCDVLTTTPKELLVGA
ncbi:MAG TPA: Xaa-Pro peptidase family protein [Acidimicrobiia bacterium]|nr:Xaa-Pro peptidase family protein [Acidimicrobiia bacterium]